MDLSTTYMGLELSSPLVPSAGPLSRDIETIKQMEDAGADALVLFNRFHQPDPDIDEPAVKADLSLSTSFEMRLPLRWIAIMYEKLDASLAATTGIHGAADVAKMIMAGADVTMMCSALLKHGVGHLAKVRRSGESDEPRRRVARLLAGTGADAAAGWCFSDDRDFSTLRA